MRFRIIQDIDTTRPVNTTLTNDSAVTTEMKPRKRNLPRFLSVPFFSLILSVRSVLRIGCLNSTSLSIRANIYLNRAIRQPVAGPSIGVRGKTSFLDRPGAIQSLKLGLMSARDLNGVIAQASALV